MDGRLLMRGAASVVDSRRRGWFAIERRHIDVIRSEFDGRKVPVALAVYMALCELANDARADRLQRPRREIADHAGVNVKALDDYVAEFERLGLIAVERQKDGGVNLPNVWILTEPGAVEEGGDPDDPTPLRIPTGGDPDDPNRARLTSEREEEGEEGDSPLPPLDDALFEDDRPADAVEVVWTHWQEVFESPRSKLDAQRRKIIVEGLLAAAPPHPDPGKIEATATCCRAIDGLALSDYHRENGYVDVRYALRGGGKSPSAAATIARMVALADRCATLGNGRMVRLANSTADLSAYDAGIEEA